MEEYNKMKNYNEWENFKAVKKFTILPLRIYQYTSQTTWWSWLDTAYILKSKHYPSESSNLINWIYSYFVGYYWKNERMSWKEEYDDYINFLKNK